MIDPTVWNDQQEFNRKFRDIPTEYAARVALTKEFMLHLMSECAQLLDRTGTWKLHHRNHPQENRSVVEEELIDIFKYWLSITQLWGVSPAEIAAAYWRKSAAVRQRYAEEWIHNLGGRELVLIDIDNVLCDYLTGFLDWMTVHHPGTIRHENMARLRRERPYLNAHSMGLSEYEWESIKHMFRTHGGKRTLPLMPFAQEFLTWCKDQGWIIVLLTSRPIDRYPNIYSDTVQWLNSHALPYHYIWWGSDKADKLRHNDLLSRVRFAVDDDAGFIAQYAAVLPKVYWLHSSAKKGDAPSITFVWETTVREVATLQQIMEQETVCHTTMADTAPAPTSKANNPLPPQSVDRTDST